MIVESVDVVLDQDVAQLGNLVEAPFGVGHESESVGADHGPGVQDAAAAHDAPLVDLHPGVERRAVADHDAAADVDLRVDLAPLANAGALLDDREVADVALLAHAGARSDGGALADPLAAGLGGLVHGQQAHDARRGVVHAHERRRDGLRRGERPVHEHDRCAGGVEAGFVFRIGQVGQRSGLASLDRGDGVYFGVLVADDFAAEKSGDHFGCEFHHGVL